MSWRKKDDNSGRSNNRRDAGRARDRRSRRGKPDISGLGNGSVGNFFGPQNPSLDESGFAHFSGASAVEMNEEARPQTAAQLAQELAVKAAPHLTYTIGGVKVRFPCKPYPSQFSMMDKIIKGLDRGQNCLLESPTGSGKSLALLCSALAWQQAYREKMQQETQADSKESCCKCNKNQPLDQRASNQMPVLPATEVTPTSEEVILNTTVTNDQSVLEDDDDFKIPVKRIKSTGNNETAPGGRQHITIQYETPSTTPMVPPYAAEIPPPDNNGGCTCQCEQAKPAKRKVPKIFFGTRTHKQIAQIAREMSKTAYRDVRMTILASREHTCVDPEVSRLPKKNEECKNKREGPGCRFYDNVRKITHRNMEVNGLEYTWDLEDFMGFNKKHKSCPYYGARQLMDGADIVFCPYNYLIDPVIKSNMELNLKGEVLVLDEAHNIEDAAREAASYSVTQPQLEDAINDLEKLVANGVKPVEHAALKSMLLSLLDLMEKFRHTLGGDDYDQASRVWNGIDMVAQLRNANIGPDHMQTLTRHMQAVCAEDPDDRFAMKMTSATGSLLERTFIVLRFIYQEQLKYMNDYRVALVRTMTYTNSDTDGAWLGGNRRRSGRQTWLFTLHFWCMNPAVAFSDLRDVRSIVLTSGTLSPMTSFQSELDQPFPIQLEANHVIGAKQVWVGAVSKGPKGGVLLGTYQTTETFTYQDELGHLVLDVCKTVPHGVLCFLSSYKMLEKLYTRWQSTGLLSEMSRYKVVMREPRGADKDKVDFDKLLKSFYAVIQETGHADSSNGQQTGALFMAVCRGKVSEGMDFADNNARAVITVGIPFPNFKDTQVELKKKYNNEHSGSRGLLTGSEWYEIQAYRAINQALGRCIRHRHDWGALILVDERFAKNPGKYTRGLSKWVRQKVQYYGNYHQAQRSLQEFTENMIASPPGTVEEPSLSVSQMDLSMTVEVHPGPSTSTVSSTFLSPLAVRPPQHHANLSPPMDLEDKMPTTAAAGGATESVLAVAPTSFVLSSQAGGFVITQEKSVDAEATLIDLTQDNSPTKDVPCTSGTPTGDVKHFTQPATQVADQTVLAGPMPHTQVLNLNQTLDFAPGVTSTQFAMPQAVTQDFDDDFKFDPRCTSTQLKPENRLSMESPCSFSKPSETPGKSTPMNIDDDRPFAPKVWQTERRDTAEQPKENSKGKELKCRAGQLQFGGERGTGKKPTRKPKDDDPPYEPDRCSQRRKRKAPGKQLSVVVRKTEDEEVNIDERSCSPLLFDSEEQENSEKLKAGFDAVVDLLADPSLPKEVSFTDGVLVPKAEPKEVVAVLVDERKPLVNTPPVNGRSEGQEVLEKAEQPSTEQRRITDSSALSDENVPPVSDSGQRKTLRSRLSRRRVSTDGGSCPFARGDTDASGSSIAKPVTDGHLRHAPTRSMASKRKPQPTGVVFDSDHEQDDDQTLEDGAHREVLNTRRAPRNKRRRIIQPSVKSCTRSTIPDILDGLETPVKIKSVCLRCKSCGACISQPVEEERVKEEDLPGFIEFVFPQQKSAIKVLPLALDELLTSASQPIHLNTPTGLRLDSIWNENAGTCAQILRCASTKCSGDVEPLAVRVVVNQTNPDMEKRVWLLSSMTVIEDEPATDLT